MDLEVQSSGSDSTSVSSQDHDVYLQTLLSDSHLGNESLRTENNADISIGVLALQGAFAEHVSILKKLGVHVIEVRLPEELELVDGLIIPGGESTAISLVAERWNLTKPLKQFICDGRPAWGTCAGMIMLSKELTGKMKEGQMVLGGLDTSVHRNYFGSQLGSFVADVKVRDDVYSEFVTPCKAVFIRAPVVVSHGDNVKVLATIKPPNVGSREACEGADKNEVIVAVQQGNILATSFHPELTDDTRWHKLFVSIVKQHKRDQFLLPSPVDS